MIVELSAEDHAALLGGMAPRDFTLPDTPIASPEILAMVVALAARTSEQFTPAAWLIVEDGELIGMCSLKTPPQKGVVEIGYGIAPSRQRRGVASRAIADIIAWAHAHPAIHALTAETLPDGLASQHVLTRNGFAQVGERIDDEDGRVLCWRRATG